MRKKLMSLFINWSIGQTLYLQAAEVQMIILRKELQLQQQQKVSRRLVILPTPK